MSAMLKIMVQAVAVALVSPMLVLYWLGAAVCGAERVFPGYSQLLSRMPGQMGVYVRHAFYRRVLPRCGENACISFGTLFSHPTASIGRAVYVGPYCILGDVTLEDDVLVSSHVSIINGGRQHGIERLDVPIREQPGEWPHVTIGLNSWIGERAVVQADVGKHCVVGAGAVVTQRVPDYAIVMGVPARVVRFRNAQSDADDMRADAPAAQHPTAADQAAALEPFGTPSKEQA